MTRALIFAAALALVGCAKGHSLIALTIDTGNGAQLADIDHLVVRVTDVAHARDAQPFSVAVAGGTIPPSQSVTLAFGSDVNGMVRVAVDAVAADETVLSTADNSVTVAPFKSFALTVSLPASTVPDLGGPDLNPGCLPGVPANSTKFVMSHIALPTTRSEWAWDLNGDGRVDNQYGSIVGALNSQALPMQAGADNQIASGAQILLFAARANDASFKSDPCGQTELYNGLPKMPPDYSGAGTFSVDSGLTSGLFRGPFGAGDAAAPWDMGAFADSFFASPDPATATATPIVNLPLWLNASVRVPLVGMHIQYEYTGTGLVAGQINGAIRQSDVQSKLIPGMAAGFNALLMQNPCDAQCMMDQMQVKALFDNGGTPDTVHCPADMGTSRCYNPDGTCAIANDGVISVCEVGTAGLIKNVLAPDVQLFDAQGNYAPSSANTTKDSLSVGFGFTAVRASF